MSTTVHLHPEDPQARLCKQISEHLNNGELAIVPTDSGYAYVWATDQAAPRAQIERIRELDKHHRFSLLCRSLSDLADAAIIDNPQFRLIKRLTPGPFTFVVEAARRLPKELLPNRQRAIGLRIPDNKALQAILEAHGAALASASIKFSDADMETMEPWEIADRTDNLVELFVDAGYCPRKPTTVLDLRQDPPLLVRQGAGEIDFL